MKKIYYLFALVAILLAGCKGETVDVSGIVAERDSIKEASIRQQQELDNLNAFVGIVSNGLNSIAMQEGFIRFQNPEGPGLTREQMKKSLAELADMLARQRARIAELELNDGKTHSVIIYDMEREYVHCRKNGRTVPSSECKDQKLNK